MNVRAIKIGGAWYVFANAQFIICESREEALFRMQILGAKPLPAIHMKPYPDNIKLDVIYSDMAGDGLCRIRKDGKMTIGSGLAGEFDIDFDSKGDALEWIREKFAECTVEERNDGETTYVDVKPRDDWSGSRSGGPI